MYGKTLAMAVGLAAVVVMAIGMGVLYGSGPPPTPDRPRPPPPPESMMNAVIKYSPSIYRAMIEQDARAYGVPAPTVEEMAQPNSYFQEGRADGRGSGKNRKRLKAGSHFETPHLKVSLQVTKVQASQGSGLLYAVDHLVLRIENRTPRFLAYRVETNVTNRKKCGTKGNIEHNAIVIQPLQALLRTECLYRSDETVEIENIEVMELPPLPKDVTRQRIYLETMEGILSKSNKVIIEGGQGGSGVVPYLPLPEIQKRAATPGQ